MGDFQAKSGGAWSKVQTPYVNQGGVWTPPQKIWGKQNGVWEKLWPNIAIYEYTIPTVGFQQVKGPVTFVGGMSFDTIPPWATYALSLGSGENIRVNYVSDAVNKPSPGIYDQNIFSFARYRTSDNTNMDSNFAINFALKDGVTMYLLRKSDEFVLEGPETNATFLNNGANYSTEVRNNRRAIYPYDDNSRTYSVWTDNRKLGTPVLNEPGPDVLFRVVDPNP